MTERLEPATKRLLETAVDHAEGDGAIEPVHVLFAFFDGGMLPPELGQTVRSASVRRAIRASLIASPTFSSPYRGAEPGITVSSRPSPAAAGEAMPRSEATAHLIARAASLAGYMFATTSPNHLAAALMEDVIVQGAIRTALARLELEETDNLEGASLEGAFRKMLGRRWLSEALEWTGVDAQDLRARPSSPNDPGNVRSYLRRLAKPADILDDVVLIHAIQDKTAGPWLESLGVRLHPLMMRLTHERTEPDPSPEPAASEMEEVVLFDDPFTAGGVLLGVLEEAFQVSKARAVRLVMRLVEDGHVVLGAWRAPIARQRVDAARALAASRSAPIRIELRSLPSGGRAKPIESARGR